MVLYIYVYINDKDVEFLVLIHMSDEMGGVESVQYGKQAPKGCLLTVDVEQPQYVHHY